MASSLRVDAAFRGLLPILKYIYVRRQNTLRQAVSLWIALQTQRWRLDPAIFPSDTVREPIFHFEAIDFLRREVINQDAAWRGFFTAAGIAPLVLEYEQFSANLSHALRRVVDFLQTEDEPINGFAQPPLMKQADHRSEAFVRMYEASERLRARDSHIASQETLDSQQPIRCVANSS